MFSQETRTRFFVRTHIPPSADYESTWYAHDYNADSLQRYDTQNEGTTDKMLRGWGARLDVARHASSITEWSEENWEQLSVERFIFFLIYPTCPVLRYKDQMCAFADISVRDMCRTGIQRSLFTSATMNRRVQVHIMPFERKRVIEPIIALPSYDGIRFYRGEGKEELVTVVLETTYKVYLGGDQHIPFDAPSQVYEETRKALYEQVKDFNFAKGDYSRNMASYVTLRHAQHLSQLRTILLSVDGLCAFPADGMGLGVRLRPGSISGDVVKHWLTHSDTRQEDIGATVRRAGKDAVIIIMYAAVFLSEEDKILLASISNPVIFCDAHYYPLPIRHVKVHGPHVWSYRWKGALSQDVPSDSSIIEETPIHSDNLLFLDRTIDVQEWTKTISWYTQVQRGRVTSTLPWMLDFLISLGSNVVRGESTPALMDLKKGLALERPFFFIPIGAIYDRCEKVDRSVHYELPVGKVYQVDLDHAKLFPYSEDDMVWSTFPQDYSKELATPTIHQHIRIQFVEQEWGRIALQDNSHMEVVFKDKKVVFFKLRPELFPLLATQLYGEKRPRSFLRAISSWYGGFPPSLHGGSKRGKKKR